MRPAFDLVGHTNGVNAIIASPTEDLVVSGGLDKTLRVWSLTQHDRPLAIIQQDEPTTRLTFAPDGRLFASGSWAGEVTVWDAAGPRIRWTNHRHTNMIGALGFSPDSAHLASASDDRTAKIWTAGEGEHITSLPGTDFVTAVCFGRDGHRFYCGGYDSRVHMYDTATWTLLGSVDLKLRG
jgi:WD40 repeat protein